MEGRHITPGANDHSGAAPAEEEASLSRGRVLALAAVCVLVPVVLLVVLARSDGSDGEAAAVDAPDVEGRLPEPGDTAPSFSVAGLDGTTVSLGDYAGRPVILTFFASWCHPCSQEIPHLNEALFEHADAELAVVGVTFQDRDEDAVRFLSELDAEWPAGSDPDGVVARAYGIRAIPVTFFIAPDGTVVDRGFGLTSADAVAEPLQRLLAA